MINIVWRFEVASGAEEEFEKQYGPKGPWVHLFGRDRAFRGTLLLRDREHQERYITIDRWDDLSSYESFRERFAEEYHEIDVQMESLTVHETKIGIFETI